MSLLRPGVLDGLGVAVTGGPAEGLRTALAALGAQLRDVEDRSEPAIGAVVHVAALSFGAGDRAGLERLLAELWRAVQPATTPMVARGQGGRVVLLAPAADHGPFAAAARAAIENLGRTLSIEWARLGISCCAILPGAGAGSDSPAVRELIGYLLSPAGGYFSGCRFELA